MFFKEIYNVNDLSQGFNMKKISFILLVITFAFSGFLSAQKPYRVGTTTANFLEIGYGAAGNAMGGAYVSVVNDLSSIYWNPAGLGYMENNEVLINVQPWFHDINSSMIGFGYVHPSLGSFAIGLIMMNYGEEEVTTIEMPEGTGEKFDGMDLSISLTYGKRLADWFSFGISGKYISSQIWHEAASAFAFDFGAIVNTKFFAWSDIPGDGLNIGMCISNYGTRLSFDGIDLKRTVDILPDENGNYAYVPVRYELDEWELPLIFRIGLSFFAYKSENHSLQIAIDALHPNNNSESFNIGGEYIMKFITFGTLHIRGGYNGLFMVDSKYGLSLGIGLGINTFNNQKIIFDYAYRDHSVLGSLHSYSLKYSF